MGHAQRLRKRRVRPGLANPRGTGQTVSMEGTCHACKRNALFIRKPVYDGFTKVGESYTCSSCGARQDGRTLSSGVAAKPRVFSDDDAPRAVKLFAEGENRRICRYCANYLVNPFTQRCFLHQKAVESTDSCLDFAPKK